MPTLTHRVSPSRNDYLERGHTQSPRRRRASDSTLEGTPPAQRPRPITSDSFRTQIECLRPPIRPAAERAIEHLTREGMALALRRDLRGAILSLPDSACDVFAHHALSVCADITGCPNIARVRPDVLQALLDQSPANRLLFVAKEAAQCVDPHDSDADRIQLIEKLGQLKYGFCQQMDTVRGPLMRLPDTRARCRVLSVMSRWPSLKTEALGCLLQTSEFLFIAPNSNDFEALSEAAKKAEVKADQKNKAITKETPTTAFLPHGSVVPDLPTEDLDHILEEWSYTCEYEFRPAPTPQNHDVSEQIGEKSLYAKNDESVMQRRRHVATLVAYKKLQTLAPLRIPSMAFKPIIHRMLQRLHVDSSYRAYFKITSQAATAAWEVWQRPYDQSEDHLRPLNHASKFDYLAGLDVTSIDVLAQILCAIASYEDTQNKQSWSASRASRELMFTALINNLALCQETSKADASGKFQIKKRVCQMGVTQQTLEAVAGYYPISLEHITPAALLTTLAEETFGARATLQEPTLEDLLFFRNDAMDRARSIFTPKGSKLPDEQALEEFEQQLMAYLYYDHDLDNKEASAS